MRKILTTFFVLPLAACVTYTPPPCADCVFASDPVKIGGNTYHISTALTSPDSMTNAKIASYERANEQCFSIGKELYVVQTGEAPDRVFDVTFECVEKGDPRLEQPQIW